ncbi:GNAT family N-acetyltransferase [Novosphingobium sp. G106]|uniref:GNAT family N-acetyltransferase n=1 Tax=Novosphingobium sp. G106 TaxID=2849500 RepID=UPI001C2CE207|nr:GNAT family N-acetyltransferase [Novosphingobium sp. G106]MBV1690784.1 GNAT family N-acetyltransferase [Novosphingobium sp. G106]
MHIGSIETFEEFHAVRDAWAAVYAADPEANFFLTHQWLDDWLKFTPGVWFILAVKETAESPDYIAFLPLRMRAKFDKKVGLYNELLPAGSYFSDYTGLLCRPEVEEEVLPLLAAHIKRDLHWAEFKLECLMMSDRRRKLFFKTFGKRRFVHKSISYLQGRTKLDNGICPAADLPDDWDAYLALLSSNNRQKIRRLLKKVDNGEQYRITIVEGEAQFAMIDTLLAQWRIKWEPAKGERTDEIIMLNRGMLQRTARAGNLFMPVFWDGDRPVAILATLVDECKGSLHFLITGRDESFSELPSGYLLHAFSIRHAIAHGFRIYDFLRGNEPYKYHFATREAHMHACSMRTNDGRNINDGLDPRSLEKSVDLANGFDDKGEYAEAEMAFRQILDTAPDHALTLYRLGRLLARKGDFEGAVPWLTRSVEAEPRGNNAWKWLGRAHQALGELKPALAAWSKVAELQPDDEEAGRIVSELQLTVAESSNISVAKAPAALPGLTAALAPPAIAIADKPFLPGSLQLVPGMPQVSPLAGLGRS